MKTHARFLISAFLLTLLFPPSAFLQAGSSPSIMGRVLAIELNANGLKPKAGNAKTKRPPGPDIWWAYTLCGPDRTYFAVSRMAPARSRLTVASPFLFTVRGNRIYYRDADGLQQFLRIIRQEKGKGCPK